MRAGVLCLRVVVEARESETFAPTDETFLKPLGLSLFNSFGSFSALSSASLSPHAPLRQPMLSTRPLPQCLPRQSSSIGCRKGEQASRRSWNRAPVSDRAPPHPTTTPTPPPARAALRRRRAVAPRRPRPPSQTASSHPSACRRLCCATSASLMAADAPSACVNNRRLGRRRTLQGLRQLRRPHALGARLRRAYPAPMARRIHQARRPTR